MTKHFLFFTALTLFFTACSDKPTTNYPATASEVAKRYCLALKDLSEVEISKYITPTRSKQVAQQLKLLSDEKKQLFHSLACKDINLTTRSDHTIRVKVDNTLGYTLIHTSGDWKVK